MFICRNNLDCCISRRNLTIPYSLMLNAVVMTRFILLNYNLLNSCVAALCWNTKCVCFVFFIAFGIFSFNTNLIYAVIYILHNVAAQVNAHIRVNVSVICLCNPLSSVILEQTNLSADWFRSKNCCCLCLWTACVNDVFFSRFIIFNFCIHIAWCDCLKFYSFILSC